MKKKTFIRRLSGPMLALIFLLHTAIPVHALSLPKNWPQAPAIASETGVVMEASSGQILFDKDMDAIRYPASTTKIMTALLILEHVTDLNEKVTFTDIILPDMEPGNSTINAQVGETLTVEECLYAILLASANEVCTQMAVYTAGSVSAFTKLMNQRARELGCTNTNFVNANGLPDPNHYTSAHDLARILAEAVKNEAFCKIAGAASYTIAPTNMTATPREMENHNLLLTDGEFHYEDAIAGKTGHTEAAKDTLVTAARRNDLTLICVVLRSENNQRFTDTAALFDYGFNNFHKEPVYWLNPGTPAGYAVLPNGIHVGNLSLSEEDTDTSRIRTYLYQGNAIMSLSAPLPLEVETRNTSDMEFFKTGTTKKVNIFFFAYLIVMAIFVIACAVTAWILVKEINYNKKHPLKQRKKAL